MKLATTTADFSAYAKTPAAALELCAILIPTLHHSVTGFTYTGNAVLPEEIGENIQPHICAVALLIAPLASVRLGSMDE